MILLNLILGSRNYFLPESHSIQVIAWCTRRFRSCSLMFLRYFVPSLLQFPSIDKPLWITTYTLHSYNVSQLILLLQDTPKFSLLFRESFELSALLFFVTWIPLRIIPALTKYPLIPVDSCMSPIFEIPFDLPKILRSLLLLKFLLAYIMVNPISLVILLASLVTIILSPLIQYAATVHHRQSNPRIIFPAQTAFLTWASSRPNYLSSIVPLVYSIDPSLIKTSASGPLFWKS